MHLQVGRVLKRVNFRQNKFSKLVIERNIEQMRVKDYKLIIEEGFRRGHSHNDSD